jgi:hypothetical protein
MAFPKNITRIVVVLACALVAGLAVYPVAAGAQAVKDEYELGPLPEASGDNDATSAPGAASSGSSDSDGGGASPVLLIVLGVTALACLAVAVWWMRRGRGPGDPQGPAGTSASNESSSQAPSSAGSATSATSTSTPS